MDLQTEVRFLISRSKAAYNAETEHLRQARECVSEQKRLRKWLDSIIESNKPLPKPIALEIAAFCRKYAKADNGICKSDS